MNSCNALILGFSMRPAQQCRCTLPERHQHLSPTSARMMRNETWRMPCLILN